MSQFCYAWVEGGATNLELSLNGRFSPSFTASVLSLQIPVLSHSGIGGITPCFDLNVTVEAETGSGQVVAFQADNDPVSGAYLVRSQGIRDLVLARVFIDGKLLTTLSYGGPAVGSFQPAFLALWTLLGLTALLLGGFICSDWFKRWRFRHSGVRSAPRGDAASAIPSAEQSQWATTNLLRQRRNAHLRTSDLQAKAIDEMKQGAQNRFAQFLPEDPLAIAVWLETTILHQEDFETTFGINLFALSKIIHAHCVAHRGAFSSREARIEWKPPEWAAGSLMRDGYFFVFIMMSELLLQAFLGTGLFTSVQMDATTKMLMSVNMGIGMMFSLPFMVSMSRNASPFVYNMVLGAVPTSVSRDIAGGLAILLPTVTVCAIVSGLVTLSVARGILLGLFALLFGTFMLGVTALYLLRVPDPHLLVAGGRSLWFMVVLIATLLLPVVASQFVTSTVPELWMGIHAVALLLACVCILVRIRSISKAWHGYLDILIHRYRRAKATFAQPREFQAFVARLSRAQREEARWIVNRCILDKRQWKTYADTSTKEFWEYYGMALDVLRTDNNGTPEKRSGELFDGNAAEITHALMYFIILGFSTVPLFFSQGGRQSDQVVARGITYAMMAFLLAAGTIELFVKCIADAQQVEVATLLLPASVAVVREGKKCAHRARVKAYAEVVSSFQLLALRFFILSTCLCYIIEPTALFVTLPFCAGYLFLLSAMLSRMFISGANDSTRTSIALALCVGFVTFAASTTCALFASSLVVAPVIGSCLAILFFRKLASASTLLSRTDLTMSVARSFVVHALFTVLEAVGFFWLGTTSILRIKYFFFNATPFTSSLAVLSAALFVQALSSLVVFGISPIIDQLLPARYARCLRSDTTDVVYEHVIVAFIALIAGLVSFYLSPLALGAVLGFLSATAMYAHEMREIVLHTDTDWQENAIDPSSIPMTSGKRVLDSGTLAQVQPEVSEQALAEALRRGVVKVLPLSFKTGDVFGNKVLDFIDNKREVFHTSALASINTTLLDQSYPDEDNDLEAGLSGQMDAHRKSDFSSSLRDSAFRPKTFCEELVLQQMSSLVDDCRENTILVYLCDATVLYARGFSALAVRHQASNAETEPVFRGGTKFDVTNSQADALAGATFWRELSTRRLNIYVGVDHELMRCLENQADPSGFDVGTIAEAMLHEYVEDLTRSHSLAVVSELALLDATGDGHLPRGTRAQLQLLSAKHSRVRHVFEQTNAEVKNKRANAKRVPLGWRFDEQAWVEVCRIEEEIALEVGKHCEGLFQRGATVGALCKAAICDATFFISTVHSLTGAAMRLWYTGLRGDLELHREVCAYVAHLDLQPALIGSFSFLLFYFSNVSRPLFRHVFTTLAWSCCQSRVYSSTKALNSGVREALFLALEDKNGPVVPGALAAAVDEIVLEQDVRLKTYWAERRAMARRRRPFRNFSPEVQRVVVEAVSPNRSPNAAAGEAMLQNLLCHKPPDLLLLARAGSAHSTIFAPGDPSKVDVIVDASATLFYVSGGVTTCLNQLISHKRIQEKCNLKVLAEVASATVPRIRGPTPCVTEIHPIALHDITPCPEASIHSERPYYELSLRRERTTAWVLRARFHPLLSELIRGCCELQGVDDRSSKVNEYFSNVFCALFEYFEQYDWMTSWGDPATRRVWVQAWLSYLARKPLAVQRLWEPSLNGLNESLMFFSQALRSLTSPLPPGDLYHTSHHGVGALKGIVHKGRYKSRLIVWDHGILLRERLSQLCADDTPLDPFTRQALIGLTRLTARLIYNSADIINPCTNTEMYQQWICTIAGRSFNSPVRDRVVPISNGTAPLENALKWAPIDGFYDNKELQDSETPTIDVKHVHAVMLSHVLPIKDIMNAVRAAHHLVYGRGFTCYRLHVFGSLDKDPAYAAQVQAEISALQLDKYVTLHGLASKFVVLPKADLFINSSFSEGLPMAILEAEMAKVPVVCTDVGGSRQVVPDARCRAPPRDPVSLGDAQALVACGFKESDDDSLLNIIALSDEARKRRMHHAEKMYDMASNDFLEEETYNKHADTIIKYATSNNPEGKGLARPPPYSVPVSQLIGVHMSNGDSGRKKGKATNTSTRRSRFVQASPQSDNNNGCPSSPLTEAMDKYDGLGSDDSDDDLNSSDEDDIIDSYENDNQHKQQEVQQELHQKNSEPQRNSRRSMRLDMAFVRNLRLGSHVPSLPQSSRKTDKLAVNRDQQQQQTDTDVDVQRTKSELAHHPFFIPAFFRSGIRGFRASPSPSQSSSLELQPSFP